MLIIRHQRWLLLQLEVHKFRRHACLRCIFNEKHTTQRDAKETMCWWISRKVYPNAMRLEEGFKCTLFNCVATSRALIIPYTTNASNGQSPSHNTKQIVKPVACWKKNGTVELKFFADRKKISPTFVMFGQCPSQAHKALQTHVANTIVSNLCRQVIIEET